MSESLVHLKRKLVSGSTASKSTSLHELARFLQTPSESLETYRDELVRSGFVPVIVDLMKIKEQPEIQCDAVSVLANFAGGSAAQAAALFKEGGVHVFLRILGNSGRMVVVEGALWGFALLLAFHRELYANILVSLGLVEKVFAAVSRFQHAIIYTRASWVLSILCLCDQPQFIKPTLILIMQLLNLVDDELSLLGALQALVLFADQDFHMAAVVATGMVPRLVELLNDSTYVTKALAIISGIAAGPYGDCELLFRCGITSRLVVLLSDELPNVRATTCSLIARILRSRGHCQKAVDAGIVPALIRILNEDDLPVRRESANVVYSLVTRGSLGQAKYVIGQGMLSALMNNMEDPYSRASQVLIWLSSNSLIHTKLELVGQGPSSRATFE